MPRNRAKTVALAPLITVTGVLRAKNDAKGAIAFLRYTAGNDTTPKQVPASRIHPDDLANIDREDLKRNFSDIKLHLANGKYYVEWVLLIGLSHQLRR